MRVFGVFFNVYNPLEKHGFAAVRTREKNCRIFYKAEPELRKDTQKIRAGKFH